MGVAGGVRGEHPVRDTHPPPKPLWCPAACRKHPPERFPTHGAQAVPCDEITAGKIMFSCLFFTEFVSSMKKNSDSSRLFSGCFSWWFNPFLDVNAGFCQKKVRNYQWRGKQNKIK